MDKFVLNGPKDTSGIPHKPLGTLFQDIFSTLDKDAIAVINATTGQRITYSQLLQMSKNLATSLRLLGVSKHDTIALVAENSTEFLTAYLAGLLIAATVHLINPKFTPYELAHILRLSKPSMVLCTEKTQRNVKQVVTDLDHVKTVICLDSTKILTKYQNQDFQVEDDVDSEDHIAVICNSSGTTGTSKGVMVNHETLRLHLIDGSDPTFFGFRSTEKILLILPFFHMYGLCVVNGALFTGATIIPFDAFEPDFFLKTVEQYGVETLILVPTLVNFFIRSPLVEKYDLSRVKRAFCGGSCLPDEDATALLKRLNINELGNGYGMTEAGVLLFAKNKWDSVGKVIWGYHLKIVDLEKGHALPPLQTGELCIKGCIMKGYVNDPEKTKEVIDSDGFLHSGDVGYYDSNGFVYINGRIKEIIKYKSFQVAPVELEQILIKFKGIKEVAVVGKPDQKFGELPTAVVVKEEGVVVTEKQICDHLAKFVSEEKRLHGGVVFVDNIPKNSMGKVIRHELIQMFKD